MYFPEGKNVIEVNLFRYKNSKVKEGNRNVTIGGIAVRLMFLNAKNVEDLDDKLRKKKLSFILGINNKICSPPLPLNEVIKSFNSNCNRFIEGRIDISQFYTKKWIQSIKK